MKQIMKHMRSLLENGRYLSLFTVSLLAFALIGDTRRYIFDDICKAQNMAQIGAPWLNISAFAAGMAAVGIAVGLVALFFFRKKLTFPVIALTDAVAGLFSVVLLFFTPYTLQLMAPAQNLQNLSVVATFTVLVLSTIAIAFSVFSLGSHMLIVLRHDTRYAAQVVSLAMVVAVLPSVVCAALGGSYRIFVGIVGTALLLLGTWNGFFGKKDAIWENGGMVFGKNGKIAFGIFLFAAVAVIVALAATVEHLVKF